MSKTSSNSSRNLEIVERHLVQVFGDQIEIVRVNDGFLYVPLSSLCAILKLNLTEEAHHLQNHSILRENLVANLVDANNESTELLRIDMMTLWLVYLDVNRVDESHRHELEALQSGAALVLQEAFYEGRLVAMGTLAHFLQDGSAPAKVYKEAIALAVLARQHMLNYLDKLLTP